MSRYSTWFGTWFSASCNTWPLFNLRPFLLVIFCHTLASCAFTPEQQTHITEPDWEISGKIGIKESTLRASSSLFQWKQQDEQYIIYLFNTLGQTQLTLSGNNSFAKIEKMNGDTATANTPEELLKQVTGWYFPISSMRYWLQGKTQGDEHNIIRTSEGNLNTFSTSHWQATLEKYKDVAQQPLPHKIKLQKNDLKITLIIKQHANFTP